MKVVLKSDEYTIFQRRDQRYAVRDSNRSWVNGDAKTAILRDNNLIQAPAAKRPEPEQNAEPAAAADAAGDDNA